MKIENNVIIFKSLNKYYVEEYEDIKPYTVRYFNTDEWDEILKWIRNNPCVNKKIRIVNTETGESFERSLSHVASTFSFLDLGVGAFFMWIPEFKKLIETLEMKYSEEFNEWMYDIRPRG